MSIVRVLLVDDSLEFLEAAARFLTEQPWLTIVGRATSGRCALELIEQTSPDLVLIDLAMPEMNGLEATRLIKARPAAPLVMMMTLYDVAEYREAAALVGVDDFITKSAIRSKIIPALERLFGTAGTNTEVRQRA